MPTAPKRKAEHLRATKKVVERAKREILWDVQNGTLPALVQCFSDLHDFADANAYGGGNDESANSRFWKKVHEQLGAWMKTGVLGRSVSEPSRAVRAQRALEYYKADSGGRGPIDSNTIRDLMRLHFESGGINCTVDLYSLGITKARIVRLIIITTMSPNQSVNRSNCRLNHAKKWPITPS